MQLTFDLNRPEHYDLFLRVKRLPRYRFAGRVAEIPDEYAGLLGLPTPKPGGQEYRPSSFLFDYQRDITATAVRKGKFAVFAEPGLGKTLILLEYARHVAGLLDAGRCVLIVSPLMVVGQTLAECQRFYGNTLPVEPVSAKELPAWLKSGTAKIGITNYEAITDKVSRGRLGALILDESSTLKSFSGRWSQRLIGLGRGLDWKLCLTGTPAPNDRIEYANHAVLLDQFPTVNSFLAKFFVNRGQTDNRWELKPHALRPFYRSLSHWCVFLSDPAVYGWVGNGLAIPPINVHVHHVPLTEAQREKSMALTKGLFAEAGGFVQRGKLARLAKGIGADGKVSVRTNKPKFIKGLVDSWPDESTIIWCWYNREQESLEKVFPDAASIAGDTPLEDRLRLIADFQAGRRKVLLSKPRVLGWGLNLQVATRQVFSSLVDSWEAYYQAVKRSNRVGSSRPLNVHIPVTEIEDPMVANVLRKADRVQKDTEEQEKLFKEMSHHAA